MNKVADDLRSRLAEVGDREAHDALVSSIAEIDRLDALINNPHTTHFLEAVQLAAAPTLLAACKLALHEMRHTVAPRDSFTDAVDALDAAIARAEGPQEPT